MFGVLVVILFVMLLFTTKSKLIQIVSLPLKLFLILFGLSMAFFMIEILISLMCI